jgi:hypothetical protein
MYSRRNRHGFQIHIQEAGVPVSNLSLPRTDPLKYLTEYAAHILGGTRGDERRGYSTILRTRLRHERQDSQEALKKSLSGTSRGEDRKGHTP